MIVKGKSRPAAGTLASYIVQKKENELVSVQEVRGTLSQDVEGALREMESVAEGTRCKSFLYHASINPQEHEHLTPEQWQHAVEILEKELKLEGHQRVLVEHVKDGRAHYHCIWNRVDQDTMKAVHMSGSYAAHERAAREMEREFGLERVQGVHAERDQGELPQRAPKAWEMERGKRTGVDARAFTAEITELWNQAENGEAFAAALESRGYVLAKGDRRDFVVIDGHGDPHSLSRRSGAKAADVRGKLAGLSDELPTVEQAQELQQERAAKIEAKRQQEAEAPKVQEQDHEREQEKKAAHLGATLYDRGDMVSMNRDAMRDVEERAKLKQQEQERAARLARQQEAEKKRQAEAQKQKEQECQKKATQEREEQAKRQREQEKPKPQEQRRDHGQEKREERRARTEQTEAQQRQTQKNAMRELFERNFGKGHNAKDRETWERERER